MAALKVPVLPVLPVSGYANQPELPAPPIRGKGNGKRERETVTADLFGLERQEPRILDRKEAAAWAVMVADLAGAWDVVRHPPTAGPVSRAAPRRLRASPRGDFAISAARGAR